jgi:hypothetical protein
MNILIQSGNIKKIPWLIDAQVRELGWFTPREASLIFRGCQILGVSRQNWGLPKRDYGVRF